MCYVTERPLILWLPYVFILSYLHTILLQKKVLIHVNWELHLYIETFQLFSLNYIYEYFVKLTLFF